ncbi:allophanate hydrolase subunit 1 [uncultured Caballeronia sp.]|uniref:5-oxoprolinase subunit B family protein n=1 Tax=uncultured Caballeronia sp. TaxID=1827198 RepID=UPI0035CA2BD4
MYRVYFLGAHAGFGYLGGLDPRLHVPRLEQPRVSVPAGSVAIGGVQTGVIAQTSPSGWNLIGSTDVTFFNVGATPPALLAPGDRVRFHVSRVEA